METNFNDQTACWPAIYQSCTDPAERAKMKDNLRACLNDALEMSKLKASRGYQVLKEFVEEKKHHISNSMCMVLNDFSMPPERRRDEIFALANALKCYTELLLFIDNTIELGRKCESSLQEIESLDATLFNSQTN